MLGSVGVVTAGLIIISIVGFVVYVALLRAQGTYALHLARNPQFIMSMRLI